MAEIRFCTKCKRDTQHTYAGKLKKPYDAGDKICCVLTFGMYPLARKVFGEGSKKCLKCEACGSIVKK